MSTPTSATGDDGCTAAGPPVPVRDRMRGARGALGALLAEAGAARVRRAEAAGPATAAVCAWNHFENIPTFFNWNNRPR
ncbi:hypothetical protein GCM10010124_30590 [Pilimelia terevasa]|uniref:Uncharacterized protein n=2 Tax=Pilimelia terevasa TaxID=53372 RepID=A0A8J3BNS3_9ACTN|nr:hypothetical protein GCM10010124_30590 [Pilimelia terevasa]